MVVLLLLALPYAFPLFFMAARSLGVGGTGPTNEGWGVSIESYRHLVEETWMARSVFNSLVILLVVVVANLIFSLCVGYAFARYDFPLKGLFFGTVLITLTIPKQTLMIPLLDLMIRIGLHDTLWAMILPFCVDGFNVFLVRQYILGLPRELEEAARVDGANDLAILRKVVYPLCRPVLAVVMIHTAITTWNSFMFPLILVDSAHLRTLPVSLSMLTQGPFSTDWGTLMAGATVTALPIIILFVIGQKEVIAGLTSGATKD